LDPLVRCVGCCRSPSPQRRGLRLQPAAKRETGSCGKTDLTTNPHLPRARYDDRAVVAEEPSLGLEYPPSFRAAGVSRQEDRDQEAGSGEEESQNEADHLSARRVLDPFSTSRPYYGRAAQQHPLEPSPAQGTETPVLWSRSTATASCSFLSHSASFTGLLTDASAQARNPHLPVTAPGESGASHRQQGNSRGPNRPPDASLAPLFLHGALKIVIDAEGV
jgi:hypothetical protein